MPLAIAVTVSGTADESDLRAARFMVAQENARRAALTPPGTPLPTSTGAELRTSYQTVLSAVVVSAHGSYVKQSSEAALRNEFKTAFDAATDAQRAAALAALQA